MFKKLSRWSVILCISVCLTLLFITPTFALEDHYNQSLENINNESYIPIQFIGISTVLYEAYIGESFTVGVLIIPSNATEKITWSSDNPLVAAVDQNGTVTCISEGGATIRAKAENSNCRSTTCSVIVLKPEVDNANYTEWDIRYNVPAEKRWKIKFNQDINETITWSNGIKVKYANGNTLPSSIKIINNDTIEITPYHNYTKGSMYTLYLDSKVTSAKGIPLQTPIKMKFVIEE